MTDADLHRDIGRLEARVDGLDMRTKDMQEKLDVVYEAVVSAKGGWKTLVAVGSFAASVGAAAATFLDWLLGRGGPSL